MWFFRIIRSFFFMLDSNLLDFIPIVFNLLLDISKTSILNQAQIKEFADRVQVFLGVFMLFKISFSLITFIINPDESSDKSKGFGQLWKNVIVSLIILVLSPYIFSMAFQLQNIVLEENSLYTLIFGSERTSVLSTAGDQLAFSIIIPFITPTANDCTILVSNGKFDDKCRESIANSIDKEKRADDIFNDSKYSEVNDYILGVEYENAHLVFRESHIKLTGKNDNFIFNYFFPLTTAVIIVVILFLIIFCMDIGLRSVKLSFLQLIAPIPIISYIDPKNGKDGLFKKWYQMCFSTYLSLFIRLFSLYFGIYLLSFINSLHDNLNGAVINNGWVKIFIIIGILMFIKQLPKILESLGIKLDGGGSFTLNPFKKFENEALGGKQILGLGKKSLGFGAAVGAAGLAGSVNLASRSGQLFTKNNWLNRNGKVTFGSLVGGLTKPVRSTVGGVAGSLFRGSYKALKGEKYGKIFADSYGEAMFAKKQREDLTRKGSTFLGRLGADIARLTGNYTKAQRDSLKYGALEANHKTKIESLKKEKEDLSREKFMKQDVLNRRHSGLSKLVKRVEDSKPVKEAQQRIDSLISSGKYFAKAGDLNSNGIRAKQEIDNLRKTQVENELVSKQKIENKKNQFNNDIKVLRDNIASDKAILNNLKSSGNYYKKDAKGNLVETFVGSGRYQLTTEAELLEKSLANNQKDYAKKENEFNVEINNMQKDYDKLVSDNKNEINKRQSAFETNTAYRYVGDELTDEGKAAKALLDKKSAEELRKLINGYTDEEGNRVDPDNQVKQIMDNLEQLGLTPDAYIDKGIINKAVLYDILHAKDAIDDEYAPREADIENREKQEELEFNTAVKESKSDPTSFEVLAHQADDASHWVKTKEAPGQKVSPNIVDPRAYTRWANETTYDGPNRSGGHHHDHNGQN